MKNLVFSDSDEEVINYPKDYIPPPTKARKQLEDLSDEDEQPLSYKRLPLAKSKTHGPNTKRPQIVKELVLSDEEEKLSEHLTGPLPSPTSPLGKHEFHPVGKERAMPIISLSQVAVDFTENF